MRVNSLFTLRTESSLPGAMGGIQIVLTPKEVADAQAAGSGPSMPNTSGTPTLGTIEAGHVVEQNALGQAVLAVSPDLAAPAFQKLMFITMEGDNDFSGAFTGRIVGLHGGIRFDTDKFAAAAVYTPGLPLIASAATPGILTPKAAAADAFQAIAFVGPRGRVGSVLDVIMPQGMK